jgi:VIT1/CCC1 family predicted Fe2+/Mn2+ transporter
MKSCCFFLNKNKKKEESLRSLFFSLSSMFAGEFVATRAQESVMTGELRLESEHIKNHHSEEIEELHGLLTLIGIPEEDSSDDESITSTLRGKLITHYSNDQDSLFKIMKALEFGVIDEERRSPVVAALASFFCFIAGSMSSTIPFIFVKTPTAGLYASIIATFICLFAVGLIKTYATRENWIKSCFDNLFIPTLGGAIAFGIGKAFEKGLG